MHDWENGYEDEDENDEILWQELMRSVKPLQKDKETVTPTPPRIKDVLPKYAREELPEMRRVTPSPLPQKQVKKLRTQRIAIEARLDLHGYRMEAAQNAVLQFIRDAMRQQIRCLEIITGRGDAERGTGLLRHKVPEWLREPSVQPMILHVEPNPASRGGALLVLLRRNKNNL